MRSDSERTIELSGCDSDPYSEQKPVQCRRWDERDILRKAQEGDGNNHESRHDSEDRNIDDVPGLLHDKRENDPRESACRSVDIMLVRGKNRRGEPCPDGGNEPQERGVYTIGSETRNGERDGERYVDERNRQSGFPVVTDILFQRNEVHKKRE